MSKKNFQNECFESIEIFFSSQKNSWRRKLSKRDIEKKIEPQKFKEKKFIEVAIDEKVERISKSKIFENSRKSLRKSKYFKNRNCRFFLPKSRKYLRLTKN